MGLFSLNWFKNQKEKQIQDLKIEIKIAELEKH